jgi:hypothetical protein
MFRDWVGHELHKSDAGECAMKRKFIVAAAAVMTMVLGGYVGAAGAVTDTRGVVKSQLRDGYDSSTAEGYAHPFLWFREDTRTGGGVGLTRPDRPEEPCVGAPEGFGDTALGLTTNSTNAAKAQLINHADEVFGTPLSTVTELSYWTYQCAGTATVNDNASYQLQVDIDGDPSTVGDQTNLVYETYYNDTEEPAPQQPLEQGVWQFWNATNGNWWSNKDITCNETLVLAAGGGGAPFDQPADIGAACPNAVVYGVGVNLGSYNPGSIVAVDGLTFGSTADTITWDFGPAPK